MKNPLPSKSSNDHHYLIVALKPYLPDIITSVECIFTWYWIANLCNQYNISFVQGHELYMKSIHGAKTKNDRIDSQKISLLL